jgi:hypothetical protein
VEAHQARSVARIHAAAAVQPDQLTVRVGHPALRIVAASGASRAAAVRDGAQLRPAQPAHPGSTRRTRRPGKRSRRTSAVPRQSRAKSARSH